MLAGEVIPRVNQYRLPRLEGRFVRVRTCRLDERDSWRELLPIDALTKFVLESVDVVFREWHSFTECFSSVTLPQQ
jgi:hypothetical protein